MTPPPVPLRSRARTHSHIAAPLIVASSSVAFPFVAAPSARAQSPNPRPAQAPFQGTTSQVDLTSPANQEKLRALPVVEAVVSNDPAYKQTLTFEGYKLEDVMGLFGAWKEKLDEGHLLRLVAADGFMQSVPLSKSLFERKGVVAFREKGRSGNDPFRSFAFGKEMITPAPFYLVWDNTSYSDKRYPWPWQLVRLEIASLKELHAAAFPESSERAVRDGFQVFAARCISCHTVNLTGGTAGSEFNVPKNVTEYLAKDFFKGFVVSPQSYRARSKMSPHDYLTAREIDDVWSYLRSMRTQKICATKKACEAIE